MGSTQLRYVTELSPPPLLPSISLTLVLTPGNHPTAFTSEGRTQRGASPTSAMWGHPPIEPTEYQTVLLGRATERRNNSNTSNYRTGRRRHGERTFSFCTTAFSPCKRSHVLASSVWFRVRKSVHVDRACLVDLIKYISITNLSRPRSMRVHEWQQCRSRKSPFQHALTLQSKVKPLNSFSLTISVVIL